MRKLNILDRLHARLLEIVATGLPLIAPSMRDADLVGLAHLRGEMVDAIAAYARHVEEHVLAQATASGDAACLELALEIQADCARLQQTYADFTVRWSHRDGAANWPEYRLSAVVMMKRIRDHVETASRWHPAAARAACEL